MSEAASWVVILTAILTLAGTIATAVLGSTIITRLYYPVVEIVREPISPSDAHKLQLTVTNYGSEAATDMVLFIKSPSRIHGISNTFSTSRITLPQLNNTELMLNSTIELSRLKTDFIILSTQKFTQGTGSRLSLEISNEGGDSNNYVITAVYDQGSATAVSPSDWTFKSFIDFTRTLIFFAILIIGSLGCIVLVVFRNRFNLLGMHRRHRAETKTGSGT